MARFKKSVTQHYDTLKNSPQIHASMPVTPQPSSVWLSQQKKTDQDIIKSLMVRKEQSHIEKRSDAPLTESHSFSQSEGAIVQLQANDE